MDNPEVMASPDTKVGGMALPTDRATAAEPVVSALRDGIPSATWWHSLYQEHLQGPFPTREAAIDAGIYDYGEPFYICEGKRFKYQALHFDIERISEDFDDANFEYGPEDEGPSAAWTDDACRELESDLTAVMTAWLDRHGYRDAWAIDARDYEKIDAQAIEARRAATTGAVHESAVGATDAPTPPPISPLQPTPPAEGGVKP